MGYITPQGLENLKNFKYTTTGYSPVDNIMNHWWEFTVKQVPMWFAPNSLTVIGIAFMFLSAFIMMLFDTSFDKQIPAYVLCFSVFC